MVKAFWGGRGLTGAALAAVLILPAGCWRDFDYYEGQTEQRTRRPSVDSPRGEGEATQVSVGWSGDEEGIVCVSVDSSGGRANCQSGGASISADGRIVAFLSDARNLVPGDNNHHTDIFVRDRMTGVTKRVSVSSSGDEADSGSLYPSMSADGRFVAFCSWASNFVPGDTNNKWDIFVYDRETDEIERVSVNWSGVEANGRSGTASISTDGRFVAFWSKATNLLPGDTNGVRDVFIHDRETGDMQRVSVDSSKGEADGGSRLPSMSANRRFVAFVSEATNLVPGDTNGEPDIFVHDRKIGRTVRVSVSPSGDQAVGRSWYPSISANARFVVFESEATNLVPGDTNGKYDIFVHDCRTGRTERVSVSSSGGEANGRCRTPAIAANGRFVVFESDATNLVPDDTNGKCDIFVHDRETAKTARVNVSSSGGEADDRSVTPVISADGRFVAFESFATNLVPGDTNRARDVFVARSPLAP